MCASSLTVLRSLDDAQREIETALSQGDVDTTIATAQCLWAFCIDSQELEECLYDILATAEQFRTKLAPTACSKLSTELTYVKMDARKEYLLAGSAA